MSERLEKFRDFVKYLSEQQERRTFLNSDRDKALIVLVELIKTAKEELRIFAGNLCNHIGDAPEYISAISDFILEGGSVFILLNRYDEACVTHSNLYKRLAYFQKIGKSVTIKTTAVKPYRTGDEQQREAHFTIADHTAYRIEYDIENRTAECNFNSPEIAKATAEFFDNIFQEPQSLEIDIKTILYGDDHQ